MFCNNFQNIIEEAIRTKKNLHIKYEKDIMERDIHPYALYESTTGNIDLFSIQIQNPAKPVDKNKPRVFKLKNLSSVRIGNVTFSVASHYSDRSVENCRRMIISV